MAPYTLSGRESSVRGAKYEPWFMIDAAWSSYSRRGPRSVSIGLRLVAPLLLATPAVAAPTRPASPSVAERTSAFVEQRVSAGVDGVSGMTLGMAGAGLRYRLEPTLDVQAQLLALGSFGAPELGERAPGGAGGELGLRLVPWGNARVRPHAFTSAGLLAFLDQPFLPGGDVYEFILSFGLGADASLDERWSLGARAFMVHLSNGQGLGPHNPAYDGYGGGLELAYSFAPRVPFATRGEPLRSSDSATARPPWTPGVALDVNLGQIDEVSYTSGRARAAQRVSEAGLLLLDVESGSLAEEPFGELGLSIVGHFGVASVAAHSGYRRYAGLETLVGALQAEAHATPEVSFVGLWHQERTQVFGSVRRAALGGRFFPMPDLAVDLGIGFDRVGDADQVVDDRSDPYVQVEWALPRWSKWQLSLFIERQVSTLDLIGLRLAFDFGSSLREQARRSGFRRLR